MQKLSTDYADYADSSTDKSIELAALNLCNLRKSVDGF